MVNEIDINDKLPLFELEATSFGNLNNSSLEGNWSVIFIYPKDNTSGCTKEANDFNDKYKEFEALGVKVYGLSKDSIASHNSFANKLNLNFPLISDPDTVLIQSLGSWKEKSMYGKKYMGSERSTFLIDDKLLIKFIWRKVKVPNHVQEVINKIKELN